MTDETIQRKLNQLAKIANELVTEAKTRHGKEGRLFFEADGTFHVMSNDSHGDAPDRQQYIKFSSTGYCRMDSGAW